MTTGRQATRILLQMGVFTLDEGNIRGIACKFACSRPMWIGPYDLLVVTNEAHSFLNSVSPSFVRFGMNILAMARDEQLKSILFV